MLASGATNRNSHIMLIFLRISFNRNRKRLFIRVEEVRGPFAGKYVITHLFVASGQRAKPGNPKWIRQESSSATKSASMGIPYLKPKLKMHGNRGRTGSSMASYNFVDS